LISNRETPIELGEQGMLSGEPDHPIQTAIFAALAHRAAAYASHARGAGVRDSHTT
jgi:hypothetical protein